jgi:CubicO group peptidase (beta-lactamase class C family)
MTISNTQKFTLGLALVFLSSSTLSAFQFENSTPEEVGYDSARLVGLAEKADSLFEDGRIPNYVLSLYKDNKRYLSVARGSTKIGDGSLVTSETIYPLTSITKPIVTTGLFLLMQDGKVSLEDKLSKFFPAFADMVVAPAGDYSNQFEPQKRQITIRDLVTHTSGFTYSETIAGFGDVGKTYTELGIFSSGTIGPGGGKTMTEHMRTLSEVPLVAHPGQEFNYSVSIDVIGAIIEKISGQSLAEFLQERLFEPLEMSSTGFSVPPEKLSNTVSIYGSEPLAPNAPFKLIGPTKTEFDSIDWKIGLALPAAYYTRKPAFYSGGGGLLSTPDDFAKYLTMVANDGSFNGRVILKKEFADNHKTSLVALDTEALSNAFGEAAQYMTFGGGFGIKREPDNQELIDYIFWAGAFNTFFWLDLEDDSIGIFFTAHFPVKYNISDEMEELVDEARK